MKMKARKYGYKNVSKVTTTKIYRHKIWIILARAIFLKQIWLGATNKCPFLVGLNIINSHEYIPT